jgi:hypothetical protein
MLYPYLSIRASAFRRTGKDIGACYQASVLQKPRSAKKSVPASRSMF